ncbi:hypothetical protein [Streptomyces sp. CB03234]|uniref:hypothetical protein n=1 Tax=Streptomyces sp. (strain CB03234) TaxID=1703937 RepID=UPI00117EA242|nr:hypothetical protein [Streptomyces sp. CB03234]
MSTACGETVKEGQEGAAFPTKEQESLLWQAQSVLVGRCMRDRGFSYEVDTGNSATIRNEFPFGIDDLAWAERHGLAGPGTVQEAGARAGNPNQRYYETLTKEKQAAYMAALYGGRRNLVSVKLDNGAVVRASQQGCTAAAERELYGDFPQWFTHSTVASQFKSSALSAAMKDPAYARAMNSWARCMAGLGHEVGSPQQLRQSFEERKAVMAKEESRQLERTLAVAEATCVRREKIAQTGKRLHEVHLKRVQKKESALFQTYRSMWNEALKKSQKIIPGE